MMLCKMHCFLQPKRKLENTAEGEDGRPAKRRARKAQLKEEPEEDEGEEEVDDDSDESCAAHPCQKPTGGLSFCILFFNTFIVTMCSIIYI